MRNLITPNVLALAMLAFSATASAQIGQIQSVSGSATTQRGGQVLNSVAGMSVQVGDTLSTAALARKGIRLNDGALIRMKSGSVLRLDEFQYTPGGGENGFGRLVMDLIQGGLSVVTGAIGSVDPANFIINTPSGIINAMQGEFSVLVLTQSMPGNVQVSGADVGVYINVVGGIVLFSNDSGVHLLEPGDLIFVPNNGAPPSTPDTLPPGIDIDVDIDIDIGDPDTGIPDPDQPIDETPAPTSSPATPGPTPTPGSTVTPTPTATSSPQPTTSPTPTASSTPTPTATPSATPSATPTSSPTATPTASPTATPTPSATPTASPSATPTPTASPSATPTPTPTSTPPDPTPSPDPSLSPS